jgi:uncharacterized protein
MTGVVAYDEIKQFAENICRVFKPSKIMLFGSYSFGNPTNDSDVDILVIMPFRGNPMEKSAEIRLKTNPVFPLDLIVRTPAQVRHRLKMGDPFVRRILEKGTVLFEISGK